MTRILVHAYHWMWDGIGCSSLEGRWKKKARYVFFNCLFFFNPNRIYLHEKKKGIEEEKFVSMSMVFHMLALS